MQYIYTRVSTDQQTTDCQTIDLAKKYPEAQIVSETCSGAKARPLLQELLTRLQKGDTLIVAALDRLGRRTVEVLNLIEDLDKRGVVLISAREGLDYSTPSGRMVTQMLVSVAEMERSMISERTKAGLAQAKAKGKNVGGHRIGSGRPKSQPSQDDLNKIRKLHSKGLSTREIGELIGYSQNKVWRLLRKAVA
ncbi:MAG: recombinase family protein [Oligoflexus sp.]